MPFRRLVFLPLLLGALFVLGSSREASASEARAPGESAVPGDVVIPPSLSLDEALHTLRLRGLDLLIADAARMSAEGALQSAGRVQNPSVGFSDGPTFNYSARAPCVGCSNQNLTWNVGDNGAIVDALTGKRQLRIDVARAALLAAKLGREDAERNLEYILKVQYATLVASALTLDFTLALQRDLDHQLEINHVRYDRGAISEGDLARIEVQTAEGKQVLANARLSVRQNEVTLAFLLGARREAQSFEVDRTALDFVLPKALEQLDQGELMRRALDHRPDLKAQAVAARRAALAADLARARRMPDVQLSLGFNALGFGQGAASPAYLAPQVTTNLPIFYQQQGEIRSADASLAVRVLTHAKTASQVITDVANAYAAFLFEKRLVERVKGGILPSATLARDVVKRQYQGGTASLTDYLDAQRTYVATNIEMVSDLLAFRTAIFQLERVTGEELAR